LLVDELVDLGWTYPSGGSTSEKAYLFAARCSGVRVGTQLDVGEQIETVYASRAQMEKLLQSDDFGHAVTYAVWFRFAARGLLDAWMP
jgi:ADP-ribose pyrophosphatase